MFKNFSINQRSQDLLYIVLPPPIALALSLFFHASYFESIILFLGVPSLIFSIKAPHLVKKSLIFSVVFSLPLGFLVDYLVTVDGGWFVPFSFFPRILGVVPVEDIIFGFLSSYLAVIFYEYFFDKGSNKVIEYRLRYLILLSVILVIVFLTAYAIFPNVLVIPYAFFLICAAFLLVPLVAIMLMHPSLLVKYIYCSLYFLLISICFEPMAILLNQWQYIGSHYIGWVGVAPLLFPIEEILFFWFIYAPAILAWYEFFDDDRQ